MQSKNFYAKIWKVSLEKTTTQKKKILDFQFEPVCAQLAQITVLEATKMKKKFSMTDEVHNNGVTFEKCEKMPTS